VGYNLAYIGNDFTVPHKQNFDTEYMQALFDYGYAQARRGPVWHKRPPTFAQPDGREAMPERRPLRPPIDSDQ